MITQAHVPKNSRCEGRKAACPLMSVFMNHIETFATSRNVTIWRPGLKKIFHYLEINFFTFSSYFVLF